VADAADDEGRPRSIRFTDAQWRDIEAAAKIEGAKVDNVRPSTFVRRAAVEKARRILAR
jgi:hypothetical protein